MGTVGRVHLYVSGRVQGVWYRQSTVERAQALGLSGWVRNLPDGRVEVVAEGAPDAVDQLVAFCHEGPPLARVEGVELAAETPTGEFGTFEARR